MCLGLVLINVERLGCCFLRPGKTFLWLESTVNNEHVVTIGKSCVSFGVIRIHCDCLVEEFDALLQTIGSTLVPGVATLQIKSVSLDFFLLFDIQLESQIFKDVPGNVFLDKDYIRKFVIVVLTPQLSDVFK